MADALSRYEYVDIEVLKSLNIPISKVILEPIVSAELAKLYFLTRGRNAWHSTWVSQYSASSIFTDFSSAKIAAEKQRTQGTVFYIEDVLSLIVRSAGHSLALVEINNFGELKRLSDLPIRRYSLNDFAGHFSHVRSNSIATFAAPNKGLELPTLPFMRWHSVSTGGQSSLGWGVSGKPAVDFESAQKVVDRLMSGLAGKLT